MCTYWPRERRPIPSAKSDIYSLVAPGGAFVLSSGNSLASYCKAENVRAMVDTLLRYGGYD